MSVQGSKAAFGGAGTQRALETKIDAKQASEITKTLGVNLDKDNDFSVELNYTKDDGTMGKTFITPKDLVEVKEIAKATINAEEKMGSSTPITVKQNGQTLGTIEAKSILNK